MHGDTSSALAAAIASFNLRIPVTHVEAGLRTGLTLSPFPEELNRQAISRIASFHLAPTSTNEENLVRERVPYEQIFVTGNTGIDALQFASTLDGRVRGPGGRRGGRLGRPGRYRDRAPSRELGGRAGPDRRGDRPPRDRASRHPLRRARSTRTRSSASSSASHLSVHANVVLTEPLSYAPFAKLMARSTLIVTDSGGIQEEAPALDVPVLVTRESTERGEGVEAGTLRLVGTDPNRIVEAATLLLTDPAEHAAMAAAANPYGDGRAAERIVAALEYLAGLGPTPVRFGPGFSRKAVLIAAGYPGGRDTASGVPRGLAPDRSEEADRWVGR